MQDRYKSKVRKLLALAQSDNPHEAERARVQAEKLMAKHSIRAEGLDVITVDAKLGFKRQKPKESDLVLLSVICGVSGCHSFLATTRVCRGDSFRYFTHPRFMGLEPDAEMAAYTWDVLYRQLLSQQRNLKSEYKGISVRHLEQYSRSWALATARRISQVFGMREPSEPVTEIYEKGRTGIPKARLMEAKSTGDRDLDAALMTLGSVDGDKVRLHNAASNYGRQWAALPPSKVE